MLFMIFALMFLIGCSPKSNNGHAHKLAETPHLYWKDINVVITDINKKHWYASGHHYKMYLTVESKEYGLSESFTLNGSDAKEKWGYEEGDIIEAELYSWVMDSTGEVIRREINKVY